MIKWKCPACGTINSRGRKRRKYRCVNGACRATFDVDRLKFIIETGEPEKGSQPESEGREVFDPGVFVDSDKFANTDKKGSPEPEKGFQCPRCKTALIKNAPMCSGCGIEIDWVVNDG